MKKTFIASRSPAGHLWKLCLLSMLLFHAFTAFAQGTFSFDLRLTGNEAVPSHDFPQIARARGSYDDNSLSFTLSWIIPYFPTGAGIYGPAMRGENGPLIFDIFANAQRGLLPPNPPDPGAVWYMATIPLIGAQREQLFVGNWYFAVTSPEFPNGEIRAQIPAVPEPSTFSLIFFCGALVFGLFRAKTLLRA
jgi:hypothetical protein